MRELTIGRHLVHGLPGDPTAAALVDGAIRQINLSGDGWRQFAAKYEKAGMSYHLYDDGRIVGAAKVRLAATLEPAEGLVEQDDDRPAAPHPQQPPPEPPGRVACASRGAAPALRRGASQFRVGSRALPGGASALSSRTMAPGGKTGPLAVYAPTLGGGMSTN